MAMKVREFIAWLATQDQDATVEVLLGERGKNWNSDSYRRVDFDPEKHADYTDLRGNPHTIGKPYENARTLFLGLDE